MAELTIAGEMRQVLAEMSLIQYGKTAALDATGGKSENPDPRPSGESKPLADYWAGEWARCPGERTLVAAKGELAAWRVRQAPASEAEFDERAWMLEDGEGFSADQVARRFKTTPTLVRRLRLADGRDSEYGKPYDAPAVAVPDAAARIVNLAAQGCTERQIVMQVGVSKSTVRRALGRAA